MHSFRISMALVGALILAAAALAAPRLALGQERGPGWWWNMWEPGYAKRWGSGAMTPEHRQRMLRHWAFMNKDVPEEYLNAGNDVGYTTGAIVAGGGLYTKNCALCHGKRGLGDGKEANDMTPSPALLAHLVRGPIAVDQYLLWTISEGGKRFGTKMPAFGEALSEDEIFQIVAYMRAGFPEVPKTDEAGAGSGEGGATNER